MGVRLLDLRQQLEYAIKNDIFTRIQAKITYVFLIFRQVRLLEGVCLFILVYPPRGYVYLGGYVYLEV